jgi:KaiC/GvpD/RAD55 family RecA-like ATPase
VAGGSPRSLIIRKMRRTKHGSDIYPINITNKGLTLSNFSDVTELVEKHERKPIIRSKIKRKHKKS